MNEATVILQEYHKARVNWIAHQGALEEFMSEASPKIKELMRDVFTAAWDLGPEDLIGISFYVGEYTHRCGEWLPMEGLYDTRLTFDLQIPKIKLNTEYEVDLTRLDDPTYPPELIQEEKIEAASQKKEEENKMVAEKEKLEKKIAKLQKELEEMECT